MKLNRRFNPTCPLSTCPLTLQDYLMEVNYKEFDIIVLHNSINHLDEEACITFRESGRSYNTYKNIFTQVYHRMKPGGKLVVADCSCNNFYNAISL